MGKEIGRCQFMYTHSLTHSLTHLLWRNEANGSRISFKGTGREGVRLSQMRKKKELSEKKMKIEHMKAGKKCR